MAEGEFYNIEKIIGRRMSKGKLEYKIKWEGYSMDECTWEPIENLETAKELVKEYDQLNPFPKKKTVKSEKNKKDNNNSINNIRNKDNNQQNENIIQDNVEKIEENEDNKKNENSPIDLNNEEEEINLVNDNSDNSDDNLSQNNNLNEDKKAFKVSENLKNVVTVKQQGQILMAIVEKMDENGNINRISIPTEDLRKTNPWILLDFYESKIKFT